MNEDPLTISATQWRVHELTEAALCPSSDHRQGCECAILQRQYGPRLFKCSRLGCPFFRTGFEAKSERDRHLQTHNRPYKCDRPNCDFSHMGFGSQARLNVHLQHHEKQGRTPVAHLTNVDHNEDDVELIILDAVEANDLDLVRDFTVEIPRFSKKLLSKAVVSSSCEMLELLLEACKSRQDIEFDILFEAVRANNLEATRALLNRGASIYNLVPCMSYAMINVSPEMIKILLQYGTKDSTPKRFGSLSLTIPLQPDRFTEARVIQCLSLLRDQTAEKKAFENCFVENAQRCYSIAIAEFLLRNGVNVNTARRGYTALFWASTRKDQRAAELMRFLLESGAEPDSKSNRKGVTPIADHQGARNISKWFGISWEQLVEESRRKYAASLEMRPQ